MEYILTKDKQIQKKAEVIVKKKTVNNKIFPNHSINKNSYKQPHLDKYSISMYHPSVNYETLKNFFSVKLVKLNKPVKIVSYSD